MRKLFILSLLVWVAVGASCQHGTHKAPAYVAKTSPADYRGVYDGALGGRLPNGSGQQGEARLIIGNEVHLIVRDFAVNKLVFVKAEPLLPGYNRELREALVFRGESDDPQALKAQKVTLTRGMLPREYELKIEWAGGRGGLIGRVAKTTSIADSRGSSYFDYSDLRGVKDSASDPEESLKQTLQRLAQSKWKCLDCENLLVQPGRLTTIQKDQPSRRLYLIYCKQGGDKLAMRVHNYARKPLIPGGDSNFPGVIIEDQGRAAFTFQLRENDPDKALEAESSWRPVQVSVLTFGDTLGDSGPPYSKEEAKAGIPAGPLAMGLIMGVVSKSLGAESSVGKPSEPKDPRSELCPFCGGSGYEFTSGSGLPNNSRKPCPRCGGTGRRN